MDHSIISRLAFIKYLYQTSLSQSHAPTPLSCASILTMHDSVELFLQLASEYLNAGSAHPGFMDYWDILSKKLGRAIEQKESMRRLNKARVSLKHHGTFPSQLDIESFRGSVTSFFNDNTPLIFGVAFEDVTLIEYVNPESSRNKLKDAEEDLKKGDTLTALGKTGIAFAEMIRDYETRKRNIFYDSPFYFGRNLTSHSSISMGFIDRGFLSPDRKLAEFIDRVKESITAMQEAIKILALGLDYRKYSKFRQLTPHVVTVATGDYMIMPTFQKETVPSVDDARFCIGFVVESALALAEFDYTVSGETYKT